MRDDPRASGVRSDDPVLGGDPVDGPMIWLFGAVVAALLIAGWWVRNADHRDARHRADLGDDTWDKPYGDV